MSVILHACKQRIKEKAVYFAHTRIHSLTHMQDDSDGHICVCTRVTARRIAGGSAYVMQIQARTCVYVRSAENCPSSRLVEGRERVLTCMRWLKTNLCNLRGEIESEVVLQRRGGRPRARK